MKNDIYFMFVLLYVCFVLFCYIYCDLIMILYDSLKEESKKKTKYKYFLCKRQKQMFHKKKIKIKTIV